MIKLLQALAGVILMSYAAETTGQDHTLSSRKFQGIPSLAISPGGRLWATWYAGITPGEDQNNYVVVASSGDSGVSNWLPPRRLTEGIMMCKPTVLSSGEWILPVSTWRDTDNSARVVISTDKGQTFSFRGACNVPVEVRNYDEHMIVERKDRSLWMLVRTSYGIGESISKNRGATWSTLVPSSIQHPSARFFIRHLGSGNLLLVKHGPISKRTGRSHLTAYVSEDDGYTWSDGLLLDERSGVSYPDGQQSPDGTIHIIYDYSRTGAREILMATFTEEDVMSGNPESSTVSLRMAVSKHEGNNQESKIFAKNPIRVIQSLYSDPEGMPSHDVFLKTHGLYPNESRPNTIEIDGYFQDWRNIDGVSDMKGDHVSYLYANPDTDLLEFKVSNDDKYLYLYSRVAGAHGRTGPKGRYYWYAYIDVDRDASTGYPPTRDDNCYFGISFGDDSEAQFEFVGNKFIKTFFGFTGIGAEKEALSGALTLGPSYYSPKGRYGSRFITHDYAEGTSGDIIIALSPDGSEVEVKVELAGFLKDTSGNMLMNRGKKIDIAVGTEDSNDRYGSDDWGADSSPVIYGYLIKGTSNNWFCNEHERKRR